MPLVLLIEGDHRVRAAVTGVLRGLGHVVLPVGPVPDALRVAAGSGADVVVLGPGLPDRDEVLRLVRAVSDAPVIVVADDDPAPAPDAAEPFSAERMDARIAAVLPRSRPPAPSLEEPIAVGDLRIDVDRRRATLGAVQLTLTPREFDLLAYLARHRGRVVPKAELGREVWHRPGGRLDQTIDVHLSWLRRKLGETASTPRYLRRVHGVGIKLVEPQA